MEASMVEERGGGRLAVVTVVTVPMTSFHF